jgi:vacuolar protein sorting-associated protein VTA1
LSFVDHCPDSRFWSFQLYDIITTFGELSEEAVQSRKYAKWKAAYIHNCLKSGETPHAGPMPVEGEDDLQDVAAGGNPAPPGAMGWNANPGQQPQGPYQPQAPYQPPPPAHNFQPGGPPAHNFQPGGPPAQSFQPGGLPAYNFQPGGPPAPTANLPFHLPDPPKDPEPKNPGGFIPYNPGSSNVAAFEPSQSSSSLSPELMAKAQKYCKYIQSALTYEDVPTAINNLQKCLRLLQTGQDS